MKKISFLKTLLLGAILTVNSTLAWAQSTYKLVTSASDLVSGAKYLVANGSTGSVKLLSYQGLNNRPEAFSAVAVSNSTVKVTPAASLTNQNAAYEITLGGSTGAWTLNDVLNDMTLGPGSGNNNNLIINLTATYTITINTSNEAVMTAVTGANANGRNIIRYNSAAEVFSSYASGQNAVFLYKKQEPTMAVGDLNTTKINLVKNTVVTNEIIFGASAKVSVYNTSGQVVKTAEVSENSKLDVSALAKGMYVVTGVVNGQAVSQKIIKK